MDPDEDGEGEGCAIGVFGDVLLVRDRDVKVQAFEFVHFFCRALAFFAWESDVAYEGEVPCLGVGVLRT